MDQKAKIPSPWIFYRFYFVIYLVQALYASFMTLYLKNAGMSSELIGTLNGINYLIGFIAYPVVGAIADRASTKNRVLLAQLGAFLCVLVFFYYATSIWMLVAAVLLFSLFYNPMMGVYETIAMDYVKKYDQQYGPIRMSGTIGYAVMAAVAGFWLGQREQLMVPLYMGTTILAIGCALQMPKTPGGYQRQEGGKKGGNVYTLLRDREIRDVLILFMMYHLGSAFNVTFFGIYLQQLGGNYTMLGIANAILALFELPFHLGPGRRWMRRIGVERSLVVGMLAGTVRWTIAALCQNAWVLVLTMIFNGIMLVPTIVGVVEFLYEKSPEGLKTSAQTGLKSIFQLIGMIGANIGGGWLVGTLDAAGLDGIRIGYMVMAPMFLLTGLVIGLPLLRGARGPKAVG